MIENSIYTDVTADQAFDGVDGFNFQSITSGVDGNDRRFIIEELVHRVRRTWDRAKDPLSHPPSFTHIYHNGRHYLARGKSTGTTHSGRGGNQLTQTIVVTDDGDLGSYLPAQTYFAEEWRLEPTSSEEIEPWPHPPNVADEYGADALLSWAQNDIWVMETLPQFVTMMEQACDSEAHRMLVISTRDIDEFARWVSLGTLLLGTVRGTPLGFRGLVDDPWSAGVPVVGFSPDFATAPVDGANTVDLDTRSCSSITTSVMAIQIHRWLCDHDAFDALELIERARLWEPALGAELAIHGAEIVGDDTRVDLGRDGWELGVRVIEGLGAAQESHELDTHFDDLADVICSYRLSGHEDFRAAAAAAREANASGANGLAAAITAPALECLAIEPQHAGTFFSELHGGVAMSWHDSIDTQLVRGVLSDLVKTVEKDALPDVLIAAAPLDALLRPRDRAIAVDRCTAFALQDPAFLTNSDDWAIGPEVRDGVRRRLLQELEQREHVAMDAVNAGAWEILTRFAADLATANAKRLEPWFTASAIHSVPPNDRAKYIAGADLSPETWFIALSKLPVGSHQLIWAQWILRCGLAEEMYDHIATELRADIEGGRTKDIKRWQDLVDIVAHLRADDDDAQNMVSEYGAAVESLDTLTKKVQRIGNRIRFPGAKASTETEKD